MTAINPGPVWHEVPAFTQNPRGRFLVEYNESGDDVRMWIHEEPKKPAPVTAEATVARIQEAITIMQTADIGAPKIGPGELQQILDGMTYDETFTVKSALVLPTVPQTVIEVTWKAEAYQEDSQNELTLMRNGHWRGIKGLYIADLLVKDIIDYKVLAQPVATTAKTVLERRHELRMEGHEFPDEQIAAEYGFEIWD